MKSKSRDGNWSASNGTIYGVYVGLWVPSILILWVGVRLTLLAPDITEAILIGS